MKILVTGGTGFIGGHLIPKLVQRGHDVYALHRYVTGRYVLGKNVKSVYADLKDYSAVEGAVKLVQPEVVIHLASISPVAYSYDHPQEVTRINYLGLVNLAEAVRINCENIQHFIAAGTSEEYGNQTTFPIKETARLKPNSPYAVAKVAATKYLQYMYDAYEFPITVCRPFNTYGRTDNFHFVTERILTQMLLEEKEIRLGDPKPMRDLLYVDDHVNAYLEIVDADNRMAAIGEIFNFCTGVGYSIENLVKHCAEATGWTGEVVWHTIPVRPLDIHTLIGDNEKAGKYLGWKPETSLDTGLTKTIDNLKQKE